MLKLFSLIIFTVSSYSLLVTIVNLKYFKSFDKGKDLTFHPLVSIIIPARNEEKRLPSLLSSLISQSYDNFEIIVVNDQSTDSTENIIKRFEDEDGRIKGYRTEEKDFLKSGKITALTVGIKRARGSILVLTDADTVHEENSIKNALNRLENNNLDILSGYPKIESESFLSSLCTILMLLISAFVPQALSCRVPILSFANGQFIILKKESYEKSGGYGEIKGNIVDDVGLVRLCIKKGMKYAFLNLSSDFSCYMYESFADALNGMERTFSSVLTNRPLPNILIFFSLFPAIIGSLSAPLSIVFLFLFHSYAFLFLFFSSLPYALSWFIISKAHKWKTIPSLLYFAPFIVLLVLFIKSAVRRMRGKKIVWKERSLS